MLAGLPSVIARFGEQLACDVVVRGTVRYGAPQAVSLPKSSLKPGSSLLTSAPVRGAVVTEGTAAFVVSGRPVLVLQGAQPAYRDLGIGDSGPDVQQLAAGANVPPRARRVPSR